MAGGSGAHGAHPAQVALAEIHSCLDSLTASLEGGSERDLCHADLTGLVVAARRAQARLESAVLTGVGEVDARGSHVHDGALTVGAWLRMVSRSTPSEAATTVRTARVLRSGVLPATSAALTSGEISAAHAQVIATSVEGTPAGAAALIEPEALEAARTADVRAVAGVMRQFQHALDPDGADEAAVRRHERRGLTLSPTLNGSVALSGLADEVTGATITSAVDTASRPVPGDRRSPVQRRLDGLLDICKHYLESPDAPRTGGGGHPHVIVTTDGATMGASAAGGPPDESSPPDGPAPGHSFGATLSWVGHVAASTARRVACDDVTSVRIGPDGEVLGTRTDRRYFTPAQRRAMIARDGDRCFWPWCDRPTEWSDGHHLCFWAEDGPTSVSNGVLPCGGHHIQLHEGRWRAERLPDGRYVVRHRDGRVIGPEAHPPGHNRPPPHRRE